MFPQTYRALEALHVSGAKGLIFESGGRHFEYRQIQYAYDQAFRSAGLPYTGTHVLRHGGTRNLYNETSDLEVAKQLLGNSSAQSAYVYAKRQASALTKVSDRKWEAEVIAIDRKNVSPEKTLIKIRGDEKLAGVLGFEPRNTGIKIQ